MAGEIPLCWAIKSPQDKQTFIENSLNSKISKNVISKQTGVYQVKFYEWMAHLSKNEPFSDDECVESDEEYDREMVRTAIYENYLNRSAAEAAKKLGNMNAERIITWTRKLENSQVYKYKKGDEANNEI